MPRSIQFEGRLIQVPDDASDAEVAQILSAPAAPAAAAPVSGPVDPNATIAPPVGDQAWDARPAPPPPPPERSLADMVFDGTGIRSGAQLARGMRKGASAMLGLPIDAINNAPRLANLIPGVDGVGPVLDKPWLGSENIDENILGLGGLIPDAPEPRNAVERISGRVGQELGATAVPMLGLASKAATTGVSGARQMIADAKNPISKMFAQAVETSALDPARSVSRELASATAAGSGAGIFNELADNPQDGDNFWSDFFGSLAGLTSYELGTAAAGTISNTAGTLFGKPRIMDDIVQQEVADRLINNSTKAGQQFADSGRVDTSEIVAALRTPSAAEEVIPGYQANIADRTQDPGLAAYAFNTDAGTPGASTARRTGNEVAVDNKLQELAPTGSAGEFRTALETGRATKLAEASNASETARTGFETARDAVQPGTKTAAARGSMLRGALQDASDKVKATVDELWRPINEAGQEVDMAPLADDFDTLTENLPVNDQRRFTPPEAGLPRQLVEPGTPAEPTGLLDASGKPIMRPEIPANGLQEVAEFAGIRNGLTNDIRMAKASGDLQTARVRSQYLERLDDYVDQNIPAELREAYDAARAGTKDMKERFSRPGTGIAETLRTREGGSYQLDDSAVTRQFTPTDNGRIRDFKAVLAEAGTDPRARNAIADEVMDEAARFVDRPQALASFLKERSILLSEFPELKTKLEAVGTSKTALAAAEKAEKATTRQLTQKGHSATANYLQYGDERTLDAVRTVTNAGKPREAAQELVAMAGGDAKSLNNARTAFWEVVKDTGQNSASGATGNRVWNGRKLRDFIENPKNLAVAEELYKDAPEELESIKKVFGALAEADGSVRARVPGTSGTAQALNGKFDPAMSMSSVASRARSVNRGQLSPTIAGIDLVGTWLRRRSAQIQSRAIDTLSSAVVNNPGMAADLLEKFNPVDYAAKRRMLFQKYGVRATQLVNLLDEAQDEDGDMKDAIQR